MLKLIKASDFLSLNLITVQYNEFDDGPEGGHQDQPEKLEQLCVCKIALEDMTCAACVSSIQSAVSGLHGVERVAVSLTLARATIAYREAVVSIKDILCSIEEQGYGATVGERTVKENLELLQHAAEIESLRRSFADAAVLSSIMTGIEMLLNRRSFSRLVPISRLTVALAGIWVQLVDARDIHRNAWRRGITSSPTMDTLVSLSLGLGVVLSLFNMFLFGLQDASTYWSSGSFLTTVIIGGRCLELILRRKSASSFSELYQLQEKSMSVRLRKPSPGLPAEDVLIDAAMLIPDDEIVIGAGALIPCDCYVLSGETLVDQSNVTGESRPAHKRSGDFLMSGTHNLTADVVAVVTNAQEDSALEHLISSISNATEGSAGYTESNTIVSNFVWGVLLLATLGFLQTVSSTGQGAGAVTTLNVACERAMAILASACPCALGLATPSSVMAGLDAAWLRGVIVSGGFKTLKCISALTHVILDKTGTLTTGQLCVTDSEGTFDKQQRLLLALAERDDAQTHPVARAVFKWAFSSVDEQDRRRVSTVEVCNRSVILGSGVTCDIRLPDDQTWHKVHVGNERYLLDSHIECPRSPTTLLDGHGRQTVVHLGVDLQYAGGVRLEDTVRVEARAVTSHLKNDLGLKVAMLTGDVENEAKRVAKQLHITTLSGHALPTEKKAFIEDLRRRDPNACIAMIGDGLNDAPALAAADVGIFLSLGSPNARCSASKSTNSQVSEVMFTSPDLSRLPELIEIARKTVRQAERNKRWAIAYNVIAVALAMGLGERYRVRIDAAHAGTMMAFSSISVLAFSMWLRRDLAMVSFKDLERKR